MRSRYTPMSTQKMWEKNMRELDFLENQEVNNKLKCPGRLRYLRFRKNTREILQ